jgi:uncharacterized protein
LFDRNIYMTEDNEERIPDIAECEKLMAQYSMLPNIVEHSRQVMRVSLAITDYLKNGISMNRDMVIAAALLHDITKTRSLNTKEKHAASGGKLLRELGFAGVAGIVEEHVTIRNINLEGKIEEKEIVYYADKRVMHDKIVTLEERVQDLMQRYGIGEHMRGFILQNRKQAQAVERKIANFLKIDIHHALQKIN